mgnify:CR=1 FL=1
MKVCDESLYHEIAVIYRFLHLYERMETMEGEALDFITRDFDAWKRRREQRRQSEKKIKKEYLLSVILAFILCLLSYVDGKRNEYTWFYCCFLWYGFVDCYLFFIMVLEEKEEKGQYHLSAGDETDGFLLDYDSCLFFADKRCLSNDFAVN